MQTQNCRETVLMDTRENPDTTPPPAQSTTVTDAMLVAILTNSNWAKMERDAKNVDVTNITKVWPRDEAHHFFEGEC